MATNLVIKQGKTFQRTLRWESAPIIYKPISAITRAAPVSITSTGHGLVTGWRAAIVSVQGMKEINAADTPPKAKDYHSVTVVDANTITINDINSAEFKTYTSGGYIMCNTPVDMAGFAARMYIKDRVSTPALLQSTGGGTTGTTRPTTDGTDGTVTWAAVTSGAITTFWEPNKVIAPGAIIDTHILLDVTAYVVPNNTTKRIDITIPATITAAITWTKGVYDLEMESGSGIVSVLLSGLVSVEREVTV